MNKIRYLYLMGIGEMGSLALSNQLKVDFENLSLQYPPQSSLGGGSSFNVP